MGGMLNFGSLLNMLPQSSGGIGQGQSSMGPLQNRPLQGIPQGTMPMSINPLGMLSGAPMPPPPSGGFGNDVRTGGGFPRSGPGPIGMAPPAPEPFIPPMPPITSMGAGPGMGAPTPPGPAAGGGTQTGGGIRRGPTSPEPRMKPQMRTSSGPSGKTKPKPKVRKRGPAPAGRPNPWTGPGMDNDRR